MKLKTFLSTILAAALLWAVSAAATSGKNTETLKTGKKGEITLKQATKIGNTILQPGTYVVQHRVSGNDHFVRFVEMKELVKLSEAPESAGWYTYTEANNAGEIKCHVEPAGKTIDVTTVTVTEDGGPHVTKVEIKGENVAHIVL